MNTRDRDRVITAGAGVVLVVGGLAAANWANGWLWSWPTTIDLGAAGHGSPTDAGWLNSAWFAWVLAVLGIGVGAAGLAWFVARVKPTGHALALSDTSGDAGTVRIDLDSLATAVADRLERSAPVAAAKGHGRDDDGRWLVEVRASTDAIGDGAAIAGAVQARQDELDTAFGPGRVRCRLLLDPPARRARLLRRRPSTPRVR